MKVSKKYKLTLEDETHLHTLGTLRIRPIYGWLLALSLLALMLIGAGALISFTPLRTLLPGYLKESQRSASEEGLLRLDSIREAYEINQRYIDNILRVTDIDRVPGDSAAVKPISRELSADSLLLPTLNEQRFVSAREERERFNISVLAPLAADGILFSPISSDGIFTDDTRTREEAKIILPSEEGIRAVADGSAIAAFYSPADRGYTIILQHSRGFLSYYSHLGSPMVGVGDLVNTGQMIALPPHPDAKGSRYVMLRMWHNGSPIRPFDYVGIPSTPDDNASSYESPRGKL